jgi:2-polyprenyl-3-methyl-5-hydroxy-6-metoxy-1,4-benzoquinol methylase
MTFLDRFLRDWRIKKCLPYITNGSRVLDIGCFDETLLEKLTAKNIKNSIGIDPLLDSVSEKESYSLIPGQFPSAIPEGMVFDCITMLAVLEHMPKNVQETLSDRCHQLLADKGRVIITVPSPKVDDILTFLKKLNLIEGMSLEEHYGFKTEDVPHLFKSDKFRLLRHQKFQLGLNNLYVFEKK